MLTYSSFSRNIFSISAYLLVVFSSFYLTGVVSISPIYFTFVFGIFLLLVAICFYPYVKIYKKDYFSAPVLFLFTLYILLQSICLGINLKYPIFIVISVLYYPICSLALKQVSFKTLSFIAKSFLIFNILLLTVESVHRIINPTMFNWTNESNFFYMFKFNSIMFADSNDVGFLILCILCFGMYLKRHQVFRISWFVLIYLFVLLLLSFSRAAILSCLISFFFFFIYSRFNRILKIIFWITSLFLASSVVAILIQDGSFLTKLEILNNSINYLAGVSFDAFLFGVGYARSEFVLNGIYGHNFIILYLIEFGLVGLILFIFILLSIFNNTKTNFKYILVPYIIAGMSYAPYMIPYFFAIAAMIENFQIQKNLQ